MLVSIQRVSGCKNDPERPYKRHGELGLRVLLYRCPAIRPRTLPTPSSHPWVGTFFVHDPSTERLLLRRPAYVAGKLQIPGAFFDIKVIALRKVEYG